MRNRAFSSIHCDLRFKFRCDLRSSAEGLGALDVILVKTRRFSASYKFPCKARRSAIKHDEARRSATKHDEARRRVTCNCGEGKHNVLD